MHLLSRILRNAGLGSYWAVKVPFLTAKHKAARRKFAKDFINYNFSKVWYPPDVFNFNF